MEKMVSPAHRRAEAHAVVARELCSGRTACRILLLSRSTFGTSQRLRPPPNNDWPSGYGCSASSIPAMATGASPPFNARKAGPWASATSSGCGVPMACACRPPSAMWCVAESSPACRVRLRSADRHLPLPGRPAASSPLPLPSARASKDRLLQSHRVPGLRHSDPLHGPRLPARQPLGERGGARAAWPHG